MMIETTAVDCVPVSSDPEPRDGQARDSARLWQAVLGRLQFEVSPANFATWLKPTRPLRLDRDEIVVEAATSFAANHLNNGLGVVVARVVDELVGSGLRVRFVPRNADGEAPHRDPAPTIPVVGGLNPGYRFETLQIGEANRAAVEACRAVAEAENGISPLVVWGAPGMGKTHLLHATAAAACGRGWRVACLSAEEFTTLYMSAVRREAIEDFQRTMRSVRLLAIDDLQYLAGKRGTVEELIHTIDAVGNSGGTVVVASEEHPRQIGLHERLKSRLSAGFTPRVDCLEGAERAAFVRATAAGLRTELPPWAIERLVGLDVDSMRSLRGAVCAAVGLERAGLLDRRRLDAEIVRSGAAAAGVGSLTDREVIERIAAHFGVVPAAVEGRSREGSVRDARAIVVAALKARGRSLSQIGAALGDRDSSTISGLAERGRSLLAALPDLEHRLTG